MSDLKKPDREPDFMTGNMNTRSGVYFDERIEIYYGNGVSEDCEKVLYKLAYLEEEGQLLWLNEDGDRENGIKYEVLCSTENKEFAYFLAERELLK